jgi:hypothetical protein
MGDTTFHHGAMDIREQRSTYDFFMGLTKWGSLAVAALLLFLTLAWAARSSSPSSSWRSAPGSCASGKRGRSALPERRPFPT